MSEKGDWNPRAKYKQLLSHIQEVLSNGEKRTVRDVYYALEARGVKFEYRFVKRAVKRGRRAGYIDPSQIIDTSRQAETVPATGYESPRAFVDEQVRGIADSYWRDPWKDQPTYVEVWLEKASLGNVFAPICDEHYVRLEATRGDWSDSKVYEAANRLAKPLVNGSDVHILYFGDFNPSGFHAPVSILDTLGYYDLNINRPFPSSEEYAYFHPEVGSPFGFDSEPGGRVDLHFERCGLNLEHIKQFDLPENPVPSSHYKDKKLRKHFRQFVSGGRDVNVELNALKEYEREFLENLVRSKIQARIDSEQWEESIAHVHDARDALSDTLSVNEATLDTLDSLD